MSVTFSVVVPTKGRETLTRTLASIAPQLADGDELLVMRLECEWGNQARDLMMSKATGTHLLFMDDDDVYTEGAFDVIRNTVAAAPSALHVFRMSHGEGITWNAPQFGVGNVGTPMVCVPNLPDKLGKWDNREREISDFRFLEDTLKAVGGPAEFHEHIVADIRP